MPRPAKPKQGRARRGTGSVYKRTDGQWVGVVDLGYDANDKRRRRLFYSPTRREVEAKLKEAQRLRDEGKPIPTERLTVKAWLETWLETYAKPGVRATTLQSYQEICRLHLIPSLGHMKLKDLGPEHVQRILNQKLEGGLSPRRVTLIRSTLRRALNQAIANRHISRNAAKESIAPKQRHFEPHPLPADQARQLLDGAKGHRLSPMLVLAVTAGMRQGELLGLEWSSVDFERGTVRVHQALHRLPGGGFELRPPKSEQSRRTLYLPRMTVESLKQWRMQQLQERLSLGAAWRGNDYVFTNDAGAPINASNLVHAFHRLLEVLGLPRIRFHDLRSTAASLAAAQGATPRALQDFLGHQSAVLSLNVYTRSHDGLKRDLATQMDAIFGT